MGAKNSKKDLVKNNPYNQNKGGKNVNNSNRIVTPTSPSNRTANGLELSEADLTFLTEQTKLNREDISQIFDRFKHNNPDGKLDKNEFLVIYNQLRPEPPELLNEISDFVFRAFDSDHSGYLNFQEFLIGYALTTRGDLRKKLEYAFALYDSDNNGYLDSNEVKDVITGMLDLLGADKRNVDPVKLATECIQQLDSSRDGKVSKDEFIEGLLKNYSLRALMSPFN